MNRELMSFTRGVAGLLLGWVAGCGGGDPADAPEGKLFSDDFEEADASQWTPYAGGWTISPEGGGRVMEASDAMPSQTVAGSRRWTDYVVQARVTLWDDEGEVGLLGRVEGTHHYYELVLGPDLERGERSWAIRRRIEHAWDVLASGPFPYEIGVPYVLRFELIGPRLTASLSDDGGASFTELGASTDATFPFGKIGLGANFARASFDDVSVDDLSVDGGAASLVSGPWGPIAELRDNTATFPSGKPAGGWYVTPIHATLRAADGKVVVTGFGRKAEAHCTNGATGTQREVGETFVLDPAAIDRVADGDTLYVQPLNEQNLDPEHEVLYCAGHNTLADGRIFYTGGTDFPSKLPNSFPELGLAYARVYDPRSGALTRISTNMKGSQPETPGMKWYPTNLLMPDSQVLVFGGFHWSGGGAGVKPNRSLELFDPRVWDTNPSADPWKVLTQHTEGSSETTPTRGYTNLFLLPKAVPARDAGGLARSVALMGGHGKVFLFNPEPGPTGTQRLHARTNAMITNPSTTQKGEGASGLMMPDGTLLFANGGHDAMGSQRVHFYNPYEDRWSTLDTGISRVYSNALWLPNGTVLVVNGYVSEPGNRNDVPSPLGGPDGVRKPQIIDPFARTVSTQAAWPEPTGRGYHSFAILLKDGRVLIAGGKDWDHATGCEKNEVRVYSPPYLSAGPRPAITNVSNGQQLAVAGANLTINYTGTVRSARGVVLMAPGSVTHAFDAGQRYVPLSVVSGPSAGRVTVAMPPSPSVAPPGDYVLYVISDRGVPSVGVHVRLVAPTSCEYTVGTSAFIEAEQSSLRVGPFQRISDSARSAGAYMQVNPTSGSTTTVPDEGKVMSYDLNVTTTGDYTLWMLASGPSTSADSFYASVDGNADLVFDSLPASTWRWVRSTSPLRMAAGKHTLKIKAREQGARVDKLWLTTSTATTPPAGAGSAALTCLGAGSLAINDTAAGSDGIPNNAQWALLPRFGGGSGQRAFPDRTHSIAALPAAAAHLAGKPWIRPSADSRNYTSTTRPLGAVTVNGSFMYIAIDSRHTTTFLTSAGFTNQGYSITVNEGTTPRPYNVWRKAITPGTTVTLPTMSSNVAPTYLVILG